MCLSYHGTLGHHVLEVVLVPTRRACSHAECVQGSMQGLDQAEQIGKQFVEHYYQTFQSDKGNLGRLYHAESVLNWEGRRHVGQQAIAQHLSSLPFGKIEFKFRTVDCQPTASSGVLVFVTGQLITEGESKPLDFSQVFHLLNANNAWTLSNDMFRLNYG